MASSEHDQLERLTFFSDAVFAIAMTLLVIDVRLPALHGASDIALANTLLRLIPNYIAFATSFLVIARFWVGHHQLFGMLRASDGRLLWWNLFLLLAIAFMPFPSAVLSEYPHLRVGECFYAAWLMLIGALNLAVVRVALSRPALVLENVSAAAIPARYRTSLIPLLIGATAFVTALIWPWAGIIALGVGSPVCGMVMRRLARAT